MRTLPSVGRTALASLVWFALVACDSERSEGSEPPGTSAGDSSNDGQATEGSGDSATLCDPVGSGSVQVDGQDLQFRCVGGGYGRTIDNTPMSWVRFYLKPIEHDGQTIDSAVLHCNFVHHGVADPPPPAGVQDTGSPCFVVDEFDDAQGRVYWGPYPAPDTELVYSTATLADFAGSFRFTAVEITQMDELGEIVGTVTGEFRVHPRIDEWPDDDRLEAIPTIDPRRYD